MPPAREAAFKGGAFAVAVRELVGNYMALEEFYLESTTAMAMRIDEAVSDQSLPLHMLAAVLLC